MRWRIRSAKHLPARIREQETWITQYEADIAQGQGAHTAGSGNLSSHADRGSLLHGEKGGRTGIIDACKAMKSPEPVLLGAYRGLSMELS